MSRGQMLEAFEAHKAKIARSLIDGGEGKRVRDFLERHVRLSDFEAGWEASRAALVVELPKPDQHYDPDAWLTFNECKAAIEAQGLKVAP